MDTQKSMYAYLRDAIKDYDGEKIHYFGNSINAAETLRYIDSVATYLTGIGVKKGDVVGICLPNIPQGIFAFYAVNKIGAVANVMHPKIGAERLKDIVVKTHTKVLFVFDRFLKKNLAYIDKVKVIYCRASQFLPTSKKILSRCFEPIISSDFTCLSDILHLPATPEYADDGSSDAVYLHSAGTTGEPKTVVLSSYAFNSQVENVMKGVDSLTDADPEMGMLMVLPLFHGFGLGICVHLGLSRIRVIPVPVFRPRTVIKIMKSTYINVLAGVPGFFRRLNNCKRFGGDYLEDIELIFCGGDKLDPAVKEKFELTLKKYGCDVPIMEGYGMSEAAGVVAINVNNVPDSLGKPVGDVKIKIDDEKEGEILVSTPSLASRYLDGEMTKVKIDGTEYLRTGDIGYIDDGNLFFCDRQKRMVKIGGVNVYPMLIEEVAKTFPNVTDACAVRIKKDGKPAIKLLIVTNGRVEQAYLTEYIGRKISAYAKPKVVEEVAFIKKNSIGKADYLGYEEEKQKAY